MTERNPNEADAKGPSRPPSYQADRAAAQRLDEIRQYLSDLQAKRQVVKRTVTKSGQELDWVPIESQTDDGKIAAPPEETRSEVPYDAARPTKRVPLELEGRDAERGPEGTVPLIRYPIDRLTPDVDLQAWLSKSGHSRPAPPDAVVRRVGPAGYNVHVAAFHSGLSFGTEGIVNVWRPWVEWSDEFSLGQLWVVGGSGAQTQTIEAGLQVRKDSYGDWEPYIFIYFTTNNYFSHGDYIGGYNRDVKGWVQTSTTLYPAAKISLTSQFNGQQYEMDFKVQYQLGNWWVKANGLWMGYYPSSLFAVTGLRNQANQVNWGGEVFDAAAHPGTTQTDMGSGLFPWEGFARAAYMRNLMIQTDQAGNMTPFTGYASAEQSDCYDIKADFTGLSPWGINFFWGGSGRNGACP